RCAKLRRRSRGQSLPVERDAMPWSVRRDRISISQDEWLRDIAIEAETMRFEIAAIWASGEEVHGDVVCSVRGDRKIISLRQVRDFHEGRNATAMGHARFRIRQTARCNQLLEFPQCPQVFAGGDRYSALVYNAGMSSDIIRNNWLFQPDKPEWLKSSGCADGFVDGPFHVGVDHQWKIVAEMFSHGGDAFHVFGKPLAAD